MVAKDGHKQESNASGLNSGKEHKIECKKGSKAVQKQKRAGEDSKEEVEDVEPHGRWRSCTGDTSYKVLTSDMDTYSPCLLSAGKNFKAV
ncbi:hypothetical protein BJX61DRAFT_18776 [Aspergillus egyptiacus]|nr:hypothetical protein BJX61DRAFT_18776 [Aspergillus egyptiacus]